MHTFILYGTSACHLCEMAQDMLMHWRENGFEFELQAVDISESDSLFERYGLLIPVLRHPDGSELNWPFEPQALTDFLS